MKEKKKVRNSFAEVISEPYREVGINIYPEDLESIKYDNIISVNEYVNRDTGVLETSSEVNKIKKSDRYKGLCVYDFNIESLKRSGAIAQAKFATMSVSNLDACDKVDSIANNIVDNNDNDKNIDVK